MGAQGEDVQLSPAARKLLPVAIETKARNSIAVGRWFEQAEEHCGKVNTAVNAVVVMKEDRKSPLVLISLKYYLQLLKGQHGKP